MEDEDFIAAVPAKESEIARKRAARSRRAAERSASVETRACDYLFNTATWVWECTNCGHGTSQPGDLGRYCSECGLKISEVSEYLKPGETPEQP